MNKHVHTLPKFLVLLILVNRPYLFIYSSITYAYICVAEYITRGRICLYDFAGRERHIGEILVALTTIRVIVNYNCN